MGAKTCENCRWVACKNYGWKRPICINYIPDSSVTDTTKISDKNK
jgi:hypothetical protein